MVSTRTNKHQNKRFFSHLNETLNDFLIGNDTNADAMGNESLEPQTDGPVDNFGSSAVSENGASHNQVFEKKTLSTKLGKRLAMLLQLSKIVSMTRF